MLAHFYVGNGRQGLLAVGVLRGEREQAGDTQGDSGWHGLRLDPERDPRHDDDKASWHISVEKVVAEATLEHEHHFQTGELSCVDRVGVHSARQLPQVDSGGLDFSHQ